MDLTRSGNHHSFFQHVRKMLHYLRLRKNTTAAEVLEQDLYFVAPLSLDAPKGEIGQITTQDNEHFEIEVYAHGLSGALGALPTVYTEWLIERYYRYGDVAGKSFLDIFNHRLHQLRYLAWQKYHSYAGAEFHGTSPISPGIQALSGIQGHPYLSQQEKYAGLFSHPVRSLVNLEIWLKNYFAVAVKVSPFTGNWKVSEESMRCCLGNTAQSLASAPMLGAVYWDIQSRFTLTLGPVLQCDAPHFFPAGRHYCTLWKQVEAYVGPGLDVDIELLIDDAFSGQTVLGKGSLGLDIRLGDTGLASHRRVRLPTYQEEKICR